MDKSSLHEKKKYKPRRLEQLREFYINVAEIHTHCYYIEDVLNGRISFKEILSKYKDVLSSWSNFKCFSSDISYIIYDIRNQVLINLLDNPSYKSGLRSRLELIYSKSSDKEKN